MKYFLYCLLFFSVKCKAQTADTINGFFKKIKGDEINYFSPLHQFANVALLTRVTGAMPISWESPVYSGNKQLVTYEFLLGHSTGTSSGDRDFDVWLNDQKLFTITTPMRKKGSYSIAGTGANNSMYNFIQQEYDVNGDAFGRFFITVPAPSVNKKAAFTIEGKNENSQDWLMIFMYQRGLKLIAQPTNMITRKENKRQLNVFVDNPYPNNTSLLIRSKSGVVHATLQTGYNKLNIPAYAPDFTGVDTLQFIVNSADTIYKPVTITPTRHFVFYIIHHSHNDIGYSDIQTKIEQIQNKNIRDAIRWINNNTTAKEKPIWHIESLWSVENFLRTASAEEEKQFVNDVKKGQIVLSANYANILTGICQPEELNWMLEYAKQLEKKYGIHIHNAMITDIPGITRSGLLAYVNNGVSYLSLGPNYVESLPDHGDRVGGVINQQGDKIFYWKPSPNSSKKLLVWTAGKGYSYFHGISESEKQQSWEKRISDYCNKLIEKKYPYDWVQLRYTKNSDNGPVDTMLTSFVENWNQQYVTPQLKIASVDQLFSDFEKKYGNTIPVRTGEISPYWEDGAYSTAVDEMKNRDLAIKTIAIGTFAKKKNEYQPLRREFYLLHRSIIMFDEHTWGSWSSISDPESDFTKEQWRIKEQFLDSAAYYYNDLSTKLHYSYQSPKPDTRSNLAITDFTIDPIHGGLNSIMTAGKNIVSGKNKYYFFEPVYASGINPMKLVQSENITVNTLEDSKLKKIVKVQADLPTMQSYNVTYSLFKNEGRLTCHYSFDKSIEKNKESFHIAFPFDFVHPDIFYGGDSGMLHYNYDQLPGSNKEFVCAEKNIEVRSNSITATLSSPLVCLYEVGNIIDEDETNGVKTWKTTNDTTSPLFLYVFNNYWHTNYKAYQDGHFDFEIELKFRSKK
jgi:hypothetical protein